MIKDCGNASCHIGKCGSLVWKYVHFMSGVYSQWGNVAARTFAVELLSNIHFMVPCQKCQNHAEQNAKLFGLREKLLESAKEQRKPLDEGSMFRVMVDYHNTVNKMLGKKQMSAAEAYKQYEHCFVGEVCSLDVNSCFSQEMPQEVDSCTVKVIALSASLGAVSVGLIGLIIYLLCKKNKSTQ